MLYLLREGRGESVSLPLSFPSATTTEYTIAYCTPDSTDNRWFVEMACILLSNLKIVIFYHQNFVLFFFAFSLFCDVHRWPLALMNTIERNLKLLQLHFSNLHILVSIFHVPPRSDDFTTAILVDLSFTISCRCSAAS